MDQVNRPEFIPDDPVVVPHRYSMQADIEIAALFAAVLAWGNRKTIVSKSLELMQLMDDSPYDFIVNHKSQDLKRFGKFVHRTFNSTDTLYFVAFLQEYYQKHRTLEVAFLPEPGSATVESGLTRFRNAFFSLPEFPRRTQKHISTPANRSACKRLNMFLRWMVRRDARGVDFGIWRRINPSQLVCPLDVHVARVARALKLICRTSLDWQAALELTERLRELDPLDPVKYDFALFGMGVSEKVNGRSLMIPTRRGSPARPPGVRVARRK